MELQEHASSDRHEADKNTTTRQEVESQKLTASDPIFDDLANVLDNSIDADALPVVSTVDKSASNRHEESACEEVASEKSTAVDSASGKGSNVVAQSASDPIFDDLANVLDQIDGDTVDDQNNAESATFEVQCPDGLGPGDVVILETGSGAVEVEIPEGVAAGENFSIEIQQC